MATSTGASRGEKREGRFLLGVALLAVLGVIWMVLRETAPAPAVVTASIPLEVPLPSERVPLETPASDASAADPPPAPAEADIAHDATPKPAEPARKPVRPSLKPPAPGATKILGRILDPGGQPIQGARVLATTAESCWPLDASGPPGATPPFEVQCDEEGRFELLGLPPGSLRVAVRAKGFAALELEDLRLLAGQELDLGVMHLQHGIVLRGRVLSKSGAPLANARILAFDDRLAGPWRALGEPMARPLARTGELGEFEAEGLPPGRWRLLIAAAGHVSAYEDGFTDASEGERGSLEVQLAPELPLSVRAPDTIGAVRVAAWVREGLPPLRLEECERGIAPLGLAAFRQGFLAGEALVLDGIALDALVEVRALDRGEDALTRDAFTRAQLVRNTGEGLELQRLDGGRLRLEVRKSFEDSPVEGFDLRLEGAVHPGSGRSKAAWPRGKVTLRDVRPLGLPRLQRDGSVRDGGPFGLVVEAEGYDLGRITDLRLAPGEELDLATLYLQPLPWLHVRVVDDRDGTRIAGAQLHLQAPESPVRLRSESRATSGSEGRARLTSLSTGDGSLLVTHPGFAPLRVPAPTHHGSEQEPVELRLRPAGAISVQALWAGGKPAAARVLRLRQGAETSPFELVPATAEAQALVDGLGRAYLGDLEPGIHSVCALPLARVDVPWGARQWVSASVTPEAVAEITQDCAALSSLEVTVLWENRPRTHLVVRLAPGREAFVDPHADRRRLRAYPSARTDASGVCRFEGLMPGPYTLRIEGQGDAWFQRREVAVGARATLARVDLGGATVAGMLLAPAGEELDLRGEIELLAWRGSWTSATVLEAGTTLEELDPEPLELGRVFGDAYAFHALPDRVELELQGLVRADGREWIAQRSLAGFEPGARYEETHLELQAASELVVRPARRLRGEGLALLAHHVDQPWGRGKLARRFGRAGSLRLQVIPAGTWRMCLARVDIAGTLLELGPWVEVQAPPHASNSAILDWPALRQ